MHSPEKRNGSPAFPDYAFCADCGARMSYSAAPYAKIVAGTDRDSEHNYQCSNYRNRHHQCFNHYIKASDLEAAILKARADTDPEAAAAIEAEKAAVSAKNRRYRENLKEQAKTDSVAAQKTIDRRIRKNKLVRKTTAEARTKATEARKELVNESA